jgi:hypothetical protein
MNAVLIQTAIKMFCHIHPLLCTIALVIEHVLFKVDGENLVAPISFDKESSNSDNFIDRISFDLMRSLGHPRTHHRLSLF